MSSQVMELRAKELAEFVIAMQEKMKDAMIKDPNRPQLPWKDYSRHHIRSRLMGEYREWFIAAESLDGYVRHVPISDPTDDSELKPFQKQGVKDEMLELLDIANFCFFQYTKLNKILQRFPQ